MIRIGWLVSVASVALMSRVAETAPAAPKAPAAQEDPEECDNLYNGEGRPRDFGKALACYRAREDWVMVTIMQLNGEGAPVDIAGARATFQRHLTGKSGGRDADDDALEGIIEERSANPAAKGRRIDFCRDVARTTVSINPCDAQAMDRKARKGAAKFARLRDKLVPAARVPFDRTLRAFDQFVTAESDRVYQRNIDGSIRNQAATAQEGVLREHLAALMKVMVPVGAGAPPPGAPRPFADADRELNDVYRAEVRGYVADYEQRAKEAADPELATQCRTYAADYRTKSQNTQRLWVRYRDAAADLAAARWPAGTDVRDVARALITEDRIRELRD